MKELLKQWAALEPERCSVFDDQGKSYYRVLIGKLFPLVDAEKLTDLGRIQHAVQEAIEARGWAWSIDSTYDYGKGKYKACINIPDDTDYWEPPYYATTAVQALLSAYLRALEMQAAEVEG